MSETITQQESGQDQLAKTFEPGAIEARWYGHWEGKGLFRPERPDATPFTIVNPPPNVTGSLHIGHALDNTLQDIVIRHERLKGKDALWVVGTDHAGIATQMVVERQLEANQDKRTNYTREQFVDKVWEWKAESGGTITRQLRRLGCSMDWSREQFTMDPHFTRAVVKVFVDLHNQGLIYRDKRLVNWDPKLKTAISDLEVETREVQGHFWRFRYPLADGVTLDSGADHIVVATTRPETMLADMAVAVHPDDERYKSVIGKHVVLPLTGRRIPIVADEHADPALGTGAVKITPGHDFNDFEVGKRAGIEARDMLNMLDAEAKVVQTVDGLIPEAFVGLDRFDARKAVVEALKAQGLLVPHVTKDKEGNETEHDAEPRTIQTPYGDRGGVVIEPWLTDQWYVNAEFLARKPIEAVRSGAIEIVPKSWEKTFFNWMENIQPWCVSRQLWWGHRIPAWYDADGKAYVAETEEEAQALAGNKPLTRDEDVLDTWFSSALWPFATLGWPDDTTLVQRHYPNDLLVSGFDILFFWDARMAMQGLHFMNEVPWKRLYLHGLVRAADGQKMSKSKGNVVDPLGLIDKYGADALRFFMAAMESQGRDVKMDEKRVEGYRNFATKLWNAARFCQANGIAASTTLEAPQATSAVNRWIVGEVVETVAALDQAMADLRFDAAANTIYHFVWDTFCDWYIELIKGSFDDETRAVAGWVLDQILVMLHPFMPFVTEELWHALGARDNELIVARWPAPQASVDADAKAEVEWLIALVSALRTAKNELGIAPGARLDAYLAAPSERTAAIIAANPAAIERLARLSAIHFAPAPAGAAMQIVAGDATLVVPLEGIIDIAAEKARLEKALAAAQKEAKALEGRLGNPSFVERAKPEAVEKARADHAHHSAESQRLAAALARLG
ncbi:MULTISPECIES: valine--tRNA ligase [unclassified Novosphingobium]|uniref:valine--tRNA ligase n=1 Tax=unclassified Novosphingobium TaxID=2644732 RepID=UPI001494B018|nr:MULTISPECIES: valine--tRNA ligase [unclassified Novosphingobium]MBB3359612.1 valyl-tRNA synthetase [Novosphingobium sp. BK256]MBB3376022.1 valyl-tRNA synthetase [Novosphingobium sp. BK280]MBB3380385.1 valyl-tRNA synthetase [Novosphingobium sp. BK258]MBB3422037.1 valyl-tRNA synthetase [Novosphingobium sp. BK267]MBB3450786.1 valyl-tRNA synthetase [Novosphingobium sp. BK352]